MTGPREAEHVTPLHKNRDFALLWSGSALSLVGSRITSIAYPLLVLALTGSAWDTGLIGFTATLPYAVCQLPAGVLVDRVNRRWLMIGCDLGRCAAIAAIAIGVLTHHLGLPLLAAASFVEGSLTVSYSLAERAAVRAVVHDTQFTAALARNEARERVAWLAGQPLGGLLFGLARWLPFLADALTYIFSLVTLTMIRSDFSRERELPAGSLLAQVADGLRWVWREQFLRAATGLVAGSNLLFQALMLDLIVIAHRHGASPAVIGGIIAASGIGGVAGALAASPLSGRLRLPVIVIGANLVWTALFPLLAISANFFLLGGVFAAMGLLGALWNVAIGVYQLRVTPDRLQGRVGSVLTMVSFGAIPVGSLLGGLLIVAVGPVRTVLVLGAGMALLTIAAVLSPAVRRAGKSGAGTESVLSQATSGKEHVDDVEGRLDGRQPGSLGGRSGARIEPRPELRSRVPGGDPLPSDSGGPGDLPPG